MDEDKVLRRKAFIELLIGVLLIMMPILIGSIISAFVKNAIGDYLIIFITIIFLILGVLKINKVRAKYKTQLKDIMKKFDKTAIIGIVIEVIVFIVCIMVLLFKLFAGN